LPIERQRRLGRRESFELQARELRPLRRSSGEYSQGQQSENFERSP